jgi:hypothetical protein
MARFAVAQVKDGRRVGGRLNCEDISSLYWQRRKGVVIERLHHFHVEENAWEEIVVEDRNATPAEVAHHAEFGRQRDVLESERREIAKQRRSESLLAPVMESFGLLRAVALVLGFCWSLLMGLRREGEPEYTAVANELLLLPGLERWTVQPRKICNDFTYICNFSCLPKPP